MTAQGATDGCARVAALATGVKRAYSTTSSGQTGVFPIPTDITDTPIALVWHERFTLALPGSPEVLNHFVRVDLWVSATDPGVAEKVMVPLVTNVIEVFRTHVGIFGNAFTAKITDGGPPSDQQANGQPFLVYPINVKCTAMSAPLYELGPTS